MAQCHLAQNPAHTVFGVARLRANLLMQAPLLLSDIVPPYELASMFHVTVTSCQPTISDCQPTFADCQTITDYHRLSLTVKMTD